MSDDLLCRTCLKPIERGVLLPWRHKNGQTPGARAHYAQGPRAPRPAAEVPASYDVGAKPDQLRTEAPVPPPVTSGVGR